MGRQEHSTCHHSWLTDLICIWNSLGYIRRFMTSRLRIWASRFVWIRVQIYALPSCSGQENANLHPYSCKPRVTNPKSVDDIQFKSTAHNALLVAHLCTFCAPREVMIFQFSYGDFYFWKNPRYQPECGTVNWGCRIDCALHLLNPDFICNGNAPFLLRCCHPPSYRVHIVICY